MRLGTRSWLLGSGLAVVAALLLTSPASAHDVLVGSSPADGAAVSVGPGTVRLNFNAPVQEGPNEITVIGPDGQHWEKSDTATVYGDSVSTQVAPLGPKGRYQVGYRIISADGHPVSGEVTFTLTTAGTGKPVVEQAASGGGSATGAQAAGPAAGGGMPIWPWLLGAVVLLAAGLFLGLRRGAPRRSNR
jgi:methionine-rich copper-binding protein CopC